MSDLIIDKLSICLKRSGKPLVRDLSFQLNKGESVTLLGESGCGKTMTCHAVMGLLNRKVFHTAGSIAFCGQELIGLPEKKRKDIYGGQIALIPQNPMTALDPSMKIGRQIDENLKLHTALSREKRKEKLLGSLEEAGLSDAERVAGSFPYSLSGGMLQRVLIAMAASTKAELIIADEPTTALDVVHRNEIIDSFLKLRESGAAVLLVTHDFSAALRLGGNAIIMRDGEIVERGKTRELYDTPESDYTRALVKASALSKGAEHAVS
ncbi:MAG: ABC transporter ATP-binding protein [Oscillospiraceae bacterium]|nr:ABC transporter ATP-binding protein [Oscillospiraceae bacterium]